MSWKKGAVVYAGHIGCDYWCFYFNVPLEGSVRMFKEASCSIVPDSQCSPLRHVKRTRHHHPLRSQSIFLQETRIVSVKCGCHQSVLIPVHLQSTCWSACLSCQSVEDSCLWVLCSLCEWQSNTHPHHISPRPNKFHCDLKNVGIFNFNIDPLYLQYGYHPIWGIFTLLKFVHLKKCLNIFWVE